MREGNGDIIMPKYAELTSRRFADSHAVLLGPPSPRGFKNFNKLHRVSLFFKPSMGRPTDRRGNNILSKATHTALVITQPPGNTKYPEVTGL